jgi:hypothetical protein
MIAARPWISIEDKLPEVGKRVEVWTLRDRLQMGGEPSHWPSYGVSFSETRWIVDGDPHAIVSHWREEPAGPVEKSSGWW